jgi:pilus assembly protein CpaC
MMQTRQCLTVWMMLLAASTAFAQTPVMHDMALMAGRGELLQFAGDVQRVVVAEPKIADAVVVSPREVMVNAKAPGHTTVVVWESGVAPARYEVSVGADNTELENTRKAFATDLKGALPATKIDFNWNGETIVLTGTAANAEESKRAQALAGARAKNVVNLIQIPPPAEPRQIMLQVKFASIDRVALSQIGFNFFSTNAKGIGALGTEQFQSPRFSQLQVQNGSVPNTSVNFADLLNLFVFRPDLNFGATITALQQQNLLQILAEPNLIVVEGKDASFLAGGQFPFPALTSTTTGGAVAPVITVQFKKFGVQLDFTPTITPSGAIDLKVSPEVSSLDFTNAVVLQGFTIPALSSRRADTEVVLRDGESFAIAGLIDNRVETQINKIKWLGDLPILGTLFKSRSSKKSTDELLVVITPRFVKPLPVTETAKLPDMVEMFLPTVAEQKAVKDKKKKHTEPQFVGPSGHQAPK